MVMAGIKRQPSYTQSCSAFTNKRQTSNLGKTSGLFSSFSSFPGGCSHGGSWGRTTLTKFLEPETISWQPPGMFMQRFGKGGCLHANYSYLCLQYGCTHIDKADNSRSFLI